MADGRGPGFFAGVLTGGIIGAALALVFAPRPGEETREILLEKSAELRNKAQELSALAKEGADELLERGKSVVEEQRAKVEEAIQAGKEAADQVTTEMLSQLEKAQREGEMS